MVSCINEEENRKSNYSDVITPFSIFNRFGNYYIQQALENK